MPFSSIADALALLRTAIMADLPSFVPDDLTVRSLDGQKMKLRFPVSLPVARPAPPANGRQLSPTEQAVLLALADGAWHTAQELADATGLAKSSGFCAVLTNLGEAGTVEASTRSGYRLPPPETE